MAGSPSEGGGVTGGPVKQVMSVKEGKGMFVPTEYLPAE